MAKTLIQSDEYRTLIKDLKSRIHAAQLKAAVTVNTQLIALYWDIGKLITERQAASHWGDDVINQISKDLTQEFERLKGFSRRNLYRIKRWYGFYSNENENVPQAVAQIPWGHNALILEKIKDCERALWYVRQTMQNGWSRNVLGIQIETCLYERQIQNQKIENFSRNLPAPQSDLARETLKDPYILDFLDLGSEAKEKEIENALVEQITRFMLELGKGFSFVGQQYHLEIGGDDFYIDLLFYHLKLHCYVVIELKTGPFKPEYAGKLNFYLTAIDEDVKTPEDNPSIGIVLCKDKNKLVAEYALKDLAKPMGVAQYEISTSIPKELEDSLPTWEDLQNKLD